MAYETDVDPPAAALPVPLPAAPALGATGEACRECGAALAPDQRYCLTCGLARADARVELETLYAPAAPPALPSRPPAPAGPPRGWFGITPPGLMYGVAGTACAFLIGLVLGLVINADDPPAVAQQAPTVIQVPAAAPAVAPAATPEPTVDPATLAPTPEPETDATPEQDPAVEKLDKAELGAQENADPDEFQKNSKKLDEAATEGEPPPTDDAAAGGGDSGETFE